MTLSDLMIAHSSPTLAGIKGGSLISLKKLTGKGNFSRDKLERKGLSFFPLSNSKGEKLLLVYRQSKLEKELADSTAARILSDAGYPENSTLDEKLLYLRKRFLSSDFPHEVGLFLSYPAKDVEAFIENRGAGYLISGLWKVYTNAEEAERTQRIYEICRKDYSRFYSRGLSLESLCVPS